MAEKGLEAKRRHILPFVRPPSAGGVADTELLRRFLATRDEAAFELLVWRHGPMVLGVCLRVLRDAHEAQDAFQATFLTLARRASSIGKGEALSSWLYKVAYRVSLRAQSQAASRAEHERPLDGLLLTEASYEPADDLAWRELRPLLDAEVHRLPEKYRAAFILCYLEGKTNEEAAEQLGCPTGTVCSRLARARERLRSRLSLRGLALGLEPLGNLLAQHGATLAPLSPVLATATAHLAVLLALKKLLVTDAPARVLELTEAAVGGLPRGRVAMLLALLLVALTGGGVVAYTQPSLLFLRSGRGSCVHHPGPGLSDTTTEPAATAGYRHP